MTTDGVFSFIRTSSLVDVRKTCLILILLKHILPKTRLLTWTREKTPLIVMYKSA